MMANFLLQEVGDLILQENGDNIITDPIESDVPLKVQLLVKRNFSDDKKIVYQFKILSHDDADVILSNYRIVQYYNSRWSDSLSFEHTTSLTTSGDVIGNCTFFNPNEKIFNDVNNPPNIYPEHTRFTHRKYNRFNSGTMRSNGSYYEGMTITVHHNNGIDTWVKHEDREYDYDINHCYTSTIATEYESEPTFILEYNSVDPEQSESVSWTKVTEYIDVVTTDPNTGIYPFSDDKDNTLISNIYIPISTQNEIKESLPFSVFTTDGENVISKGDNNSTRLVSKFDFGYLSTLERGMLNIRANEMWIQNSATISAVDIDIKMNTADFNGGSVTWDNFNTSIGDTIDTISISADNVDGYNNSVLKFDVDKLHSQSMVHDNNYGITLKHSDESGEDIFTPTFLTDGGIDPYQSPFMVMNVTSASTSAVWTGALNTSYSQPANWTPNLQPDENTYVLFDGAQYDVDCNIGIGIDVDVFSFISTNNAGALTDFIGNLISHNIVQLSGFDYVQVPDGDPDFYPNRGITMMDSGQIYLGDGGTSAMPNISIVDGADVIFESTSQGIVSTTLSVSGSLHLIDDLIIDESDVLLLDSGKISSDDDAYFILRDSSITSAGNITSNIRFEEFSAIIPSRSYSGNVIFSDNRSESQEIDYSFNTGDYLFSNGINIESTGKRISISATDASSLDISGGIETSAPAGIPTGTSATVGDLSSLLLALSSPTIVEIYTTAVITTVSDNTNVELGGTKVLRGEEIVIEHETIFTSTVLGITRDMYMYNKITYNTYASYYIGAGSWTFCRFNEIESVTYTYPLAFFHGGDAYVITPTNFTLIEGPHVGLFDWTDTNNITLHLPSTDINLYDGDINLSAVGIVNYTTGGFIINDGITSFTTNPNTMFPNISILNNTSILFLGATLKTESILIDNSYIDFNNNDMISVDSILATNLSTDAFTNLTGITLSAVDISIHGSPNNNVELISNGQWFADASNSLEARFISIKNSTASNVTGIAINSTDLLGNINWNFVREDVPPNITFSSQYTTNRFLNGEIGSVHVSVTDSGEYGAVSSADILLTSDSIGELDVNSFVVNGIQNVEFDVINISGTGYVTVSATDLYQNVNEESDGEWIYSCPNKNDRLINLVDYVPSNLHEDSEMVEFIKFFENFLNTLYYDKESNCNIGILKKIEQIMDLQDPNLMDIEFIQFFASKLGYGVDINRGDLGLFVNSGSSTYDELSGQELEDANKYLRFVVSNLPNWYKIKTTRNAVKVMLFSFGIIGDIFYMFSNDYNKNFISENHIDGVNIVNEIPSDYYPTPHFEIRVDLKETAPSWINNIRQVTDAVNSIRPVNTVFEDIAGYYRIDGDSTKVGVSGGIMSNLYSFINWSGPIAQVYGFSTYSNTTSSVDVAYVSGAPESKPVIITGYGNTLHTSYTPTQELVNYGQKFEEVMEVEFLGEEPSMSVFYSTLNSYYTNTWIGVGLSNQKPYLYLLDNSQTINLNISGTTTINYNQKYKVRLTGEIQNGDMIFKVFFDAVEEITYNVGSLTTWEFNKWVFGESSIPSNIKLYNYESTLNGSWDFVTRLQEEPEESIKFTNTNGLDMFSSSISNVFPYMDNDATSASLIGDFITSIG